jgi:hypothetical protein
MRVRTAAFIVMIAAVLPPGASAQTLEWIRQFGTDAQDRAAAIAVRAPAIYVAGATESTFGGQQSAGGVDAFVRKYDVDGTEIWTRQFGTAGIDEVLAIAVDGTGVYVAGDTQGALAAGAPAGPHAFIRKYDLNGAEQWTREFGRGRREEVLALAAGANLVYAAGDTTVTAPPFDDAFVVAFGVDGNARGGHEFGTAAVDRATAIAVDATGVYVAGATEGVLPGQTAAGDSDGFVRKYSIDGAEIWTRQFGTAESDEILAMAADASGIYVAGTTSAALDGQRAAGSVDGFVRKYDVNGQLLWTRQFGTVDYDDVLGIAISSQAVFVAGNTKGALPGQVNAGDSDVFVRKLDANGAPGWVLQFGGKGRDELLGIAADASGVYGVGVTDGTLPGQVNKGSVDAFVVKLRAR